MVNDGSSLSKRTHRKPPTDKVPHLFSLNASITWGHKDLYNQDRRGGGWWCSSCCQLPGIWTTQADIYHGLGALRNGQPGWGWDWWEYGEKKKNNSKLKVSGRQRKTSWNSIGSICSHLLGQGSDLLEWQHCGLGYNSSKDTWRLVQERCLGTRDVSFFPVVFRDVGCGRKAWRGAWFAITSMQQAWWIGASLPNHAVDGSCKKSRRIHLHLLCWMIMVHPD